MLRIPKEREVGMAYFKTLPEEVRDASWKHLAAGMQEVFEGVYEGPETLEVFVSNLWEAWLDSYVELELALVEEAVAYRPEASNEFYEFYGRDSVAADDWQRRESVLQDPALAEYLETAETRAAIAQGKRIARAPDYCYVCGRPLGAGRAELLTRWEVPVNLQKHTRWGGPVKWLVRCLTGPCSEPANGKRKPLLHPRDVGTVANRVAEPCIICGTPVDAGAGVLVPRDRIPRWLWARPAFPGAHEKRYYVLCGRQDE